MIFPDEKLELVWPVLDEDGNGKIDFKELLAFMTDNDPQKVSATAVLVIICDFAGLDHRKPDFRSRAAFLPVGFLRSRV